jgi:alanyl-tRNA synthetase
MRAHSATHLLHAGLRRELGTHVAQAGSLVARDRLRFDFTHYEAVPATVIGRIEEWVNEQVLAGHRVHTELMRLEEARRRGAMALFGEKYGEVVRTVQMGDSLELCGGTHVRSTADVGLVHILREQSIAAGVRRIEATTGRLAYADLRAAGEALDKIAEMLGAQRRDAVPERVERLLLQVRTLEQEHGRLKKQSALAQVEAAARDAMDVEGTRVVASIVSGVDRTILRELMDEVRARVGSGVVVLGADVDGKPAFVVAVSPDAVEGKGLRAGDIAGAVARIAGGGGGGRADIAQAGGRDLTQLPAAVDAVPGIVRSMLAR